MGYHTRHWGWLTFFSIQGPIVAVETVIRRQLKQHHIQLPRVVRIAVTVGVLLAIADTFFFPPLTHSGLADHVVELMKQNVDGLLGLSSSTIDSST